ncbi:MAG: hypothetical protein E6H06_10805 [Bacteroidetes bacterium]|nr:MAG: hypothetical protein E6H06_10805 [Bacteroidota bacterium]
MKTIFYKFTFRMILLIGIVVGIVKGQEARQRWVSKKKIKYEAKLDSRRHLNLDPSQVVLDEIEMSTYHS